MSEYIIAKEQIKELNRAYGGMKAVTSWLSCYAIWDTSNTYPVMKGEHVAVDLPEIVRCGDCRHMIHFWHHDDERWQCMNEMLEGLDVSPDFFCAWAKRKEGGDD